MNPSNRAKTLATLLDEFHSQYQNVPPLNIGSLLMAAYILFVYPQQSEFENMNFDTVSINDFTVATGTPTTQKRRFCSRIRNALAHGRFTVCDGLITMSDQRQDATDRFEARISVINFGKFINGFMQTVKNHHFGTLI